MGSRYDGRLNHVTSAPLDNIAAKLTTLGIKSVGILSYNGQFVEISVGKYIDYILNGGLRTKNDNYIPPKDGDHYESLSGYNVSSSDFKAIDSRLNWNTCAIEKDNRNPTQLYILYNYDVTDWLIKGWKPVDPTSLSAPMNWAKYNDPDEDYMGYFRIFFLFYTSDILFNGSNITTFGNSSLKNDYSYGANSNNNDYDWRDAGNWKANSRYYAGISMCNTKFTSNNMLKVGQTLYMGDALFSPNHQYFGIMQSDGNFVVYGPNSKSDAKWALSWDGVSNKYGGYLSMQTDGNLVAYEPPDKKAYWSSGTANAAVNSNCKLLLTNIGQLIIVRPDNTIIWRRWESSSSSYDLLVANDMHKMVYNCPYKTGTTGVTERDNKRAELIKWWDDNNNKTLQDLINKYSIKYPNIYHKQVYDDLHVLLPKNIIVTSESPTTLKLYKYNYIVKTDDQYLNNYLNRGALPMTGDSTLFHPIKQNGVNNFKNSYLTNEAACSTAIKDILYAGGLAFYDPQPTTIGVNTKDEYLGGPYPTIKIYTLKDYSTDMMKWYFQQLPINGTVITSYTGLTQSGKGSVFSNKFTSGLNNANYREYCMSSSTNNDICFPLLIDFVSNPANVSTNMGASNSSALDTYYDKVCTKMVFDTTGASYRKLDIRNACISSISKSKCIKSTNRYTFQNRDSFAGSCIDICNSSNLDPIVKKACDDGTATWCAIDINKTDPICKSFTPAPASTTPAPTTTTPAPTTTTPAPASTTPASTTPAPTTTTPAPTTTTPAPASTTPAPTTASTTPASTTLSPDKSNKDITSVGGNITPTPKPTLPPKSSLAAIEIAGIIGTVFLILLLLVGLYYLNTKKPDNSHQSSKKLHKVHPMITMDHHPVSHHSTVHHPKHRAYE